MSSRSEKMAQPNHSSTYEEEDAGTERSWAVCCALSFGTLGLAFVVGVVLLIGFFCCNWFSPHQSPTPAKPSEGLSVCKDTEMHSLECWLCQPDKLPFVTLGNERYDCVRRADHGMTGIRFEYVLHDSSKADAQHPPNVHLKYYFDMVFSPGVPATQTAFQMAWTDSNSGLMVQQQAHGAPDMEGCVFGCEMLKESQRGALKSSKGEESDRAAEFLQAAQQAGASPTKEGEQEQFLMITPPSDDVLAHLPLSGQSDPSVNRVSPTPLVPLPIRVGKSVKQLLLGPKPEDEHSNVAAKKAKGTTATAAADTGKKSTSKTSKDNLTWDSKRYLLGEAIRIGTEMETKGLCSPDAHPDNWNVILDDSKNHPGLLMRVDLGDSIFMPDVDADHNMFRFQIGCDYSKNRKQSQVTNAAAQDDSQGQEHGGSSSASSSGAGGAAVCSQEEVLTFARGFQSQLQVSFQGIFTGSVEGIKAGAWLSDLYPTKEDLNNRVCAANWLPFLLQVLQTLPENDVAHRVGDLQAAISGGKTRKEKLQNVKNLFPSVVLTDDIRQNMRFAYEHAHEKAGNRSGL